MSPATDPAAEIVLVTAVDPETEMMTAITVGEVARGNIGAGEMTPATEPGGGQMILLT